MLPDDVTGAELDRDVRADLATLAADNRAAVARHLVMAGRLLQEDPQAAHAHAVAAQRRAGRIGSVREAAGLTAYAIGRHDEALRELRTARRLTGSNAHLPLMADCERGLGRPERALALAASPEAAALDEEGRVEMRIVAAGARTDMGQADAAVVALQGPELTSPGQEPWRPRLLSAYADALAAAGRGGEARTWLARAAAVDPTGATGAARRLRAQEGHDGPDGPGGLAAEDEDEVVLYDLLADADADDAAGDAAGDDAPSHRTAGGGSSTGAGADG